MAGEPSLFLVYQDFNVNERNNGSWYGTQALADAAALAAGVDFSANQGAVTILTDGKPDGSIARSMARGA